MLRDMKKEIAELFSFINESPTSFHTVEAIRMRLENAGFIRLFETDAWKIRQGGAYYVIRADSSVIAFRIPKTSAKAFRIAASHSDSPTFRLKPNPETQVCGAYTMLNTEPYGGGIYHTWMDRPLSVAGRVIIQGAGGLETRLVNVDRDLLVIPSLAIHMKRDVNKKLDLNAQRDLLPLFGDADARGKLRELIAENVGCEESEILGEDLFLCSRLRPALIGAGEEYICSPRLDDLECVCATLLGFLQTEKVCDRIGVYCVFDNEEVGSATKQGAGSTFLADVLERICIGLGYDRETYHRMIAGSFLISADNAHAVHPAAADKADPVNRPVMNKGVVLKYSANQKYTTDGASAAALHALCLAEKIPVQDFSNRSDVTGGSTLGNISSTKVPVPAADIGLAQLAMHSVCETAGTEDFGSLVRLAACFYKS